MVFGDLNLDHARWATPEAGHEKMIDRVKTEIEILGFHQMVAGITRSMKGQPDSLLDHCWLNEPSRLI